MRRTVSICIVCVWLAMVALLVRQNWTAAPSSSPEIDQPDPAGRDEWMNVYHEGVKIGYTHSRVTADGAGFHFAEDSLLRLVVLETPQTVQTHIGGHVASDSSLRDVDFDLRSGAGTLRATGVVEPAGLRLKIMTGADVSEQVLPLNEPLFLPSLVRTALNRDTLQAGRQFTALVFDPVSLTNERMVISVDGQEPLPGAGSETKAWRVREEFRGLKTTAWTDADGLVLREEGPMGMVLVRTSAEQALHADWTSQVAHDLAASASVPVTRPIPEPRQRMSLRLRLSGIAPERVPSDELQRRTGDILTITRPALADVRSYPLPCGDGTLADDLKPTPFLQSDHPRLQQLAHEILGDERDAKRAAVLLNDWVYDHLRKVPTVSIPNALQVLDMGQGDCNEHAVLLAALGRAVGLPTRLITGAVYINDAFFYHAWCEVWLDRWVPIDPALHQVPADATHVKFIVGGLEDQLGMIDLIGHLGVEVLDAPATNND
ncbi:MAG: transglutaminase-like enzyme, predicted cysteine protease [Deltaproteobacteria bacterium]|nr:transglutaminase-like enzyme, predicted cysteine protease [Deltaproteobacteria bacterium]